jgi:hypothetical protein
MPIAPKAAKVDVVDGKRLHEWDTFERFCTDAGL